MSTIVDASGLSCPQPVLMTLGQIQKSGDPEEALVTSGDDVANVARFLAPGASTYTAADVVGYLVG